MTNLDQAAVREHHLAVRLHHAAAAGFIHVPYLRDLHRRMTNPRVGDSVIGLARIPGGYLPHAHGTLLEITQPDKASPKQGVIATYLNPEREESHRYGSLIAIPVETGTAGPADAWLRNDVLHRHMLRCIDADAATALTGDLHNQTVYADRFGRYVIFRAPDNESAQSIVSSAFEALWTTEAEADATLERATVTYGGRRLTITQP